ncbi:MAG: hypothetical protein ACM3QS_07205 [Bacteroidota bacterium]
MPLKDEVTQRDLSSRLSATLEAALEEIYNYHGTATLPREVIFDVWGAPAALPDETAAPDYFLHYFQSQGLGPTNNECVTTSTVMAMNIMEDRIAASQGQGPVQYRASLQIEDYIRDLDALGVRGWLYRFSTKSFLPGMMTPWGARNAMRAHAARLKQQYGKSYRVRTLSHRTVDDLIQALEQNKVILLHGAWQKRLTDATDRQLALMGGMPHTMVLAGYEPAVDFWNILNPAEPWLKARTDEYPPRMFKMTTAQLVDFWGRKFLFYPPRFSITTLTMEE